MKPVIKYLLTVVAIAALGLVVYVKVFVPKHTFSVVHPISGQLNVTVQGIGNVNALNIYSITAQTGGKILQILTDEGRWVKKGDLLIVMDGVDLPRQLETASADFKKAEYEVKALQGDLGNQEAQRTLLQITFSRYKKLYKQGFVAKAEYDKALADLQGIRAAIKATESRIKSSRSGVAAASKQVDALQEKIDRLRVYSPTDGYVFIKEAEVAQYVQPSSTILKIVDPASLWVEVKLDERISAQVKPSQEASIVLRSQPDRRYEGVVKRIDAMTDPVTLERTINVAFTTLPKPFFINEQARVIINVRKYDHVVKIPLTTVVQRNGKTGVWVVRNGRAHFLTIKTVAVNDSEMAIANGDSNTSILIPDNHKKSLNEGMRIYQ